MSAARDFRDFILRGNVVDLAVGIVIGAAFGAMVTALVTDFITPLLAIPGKVDFGNLTFTVGGGVFKYGHFINTVIAFLLIALVVFFFIVRPVNAVMARFKPTPEEPAPIKTCPYCRSSIAVDATRCAFCTSDLQPAARASQA